MPIGARRGAPDRGCRQGMKATCVSIELVDRGGHVERLSVREHERIAELVAAGAPFWRLRQEVPRSRFAIYRAVKRITTAPAPEPNRSPLRLSLAEREEISRGLAAGDSLRAIAGRLGRAPSTVSREVARNGGRGRYRACNADRVAVRNVCRPKVAKLARCCRRRLRSAPSTRRGRRARSWASRHDRRRWRPAQR